MKLIFENHFGGITVCDQQPWELENEIRTPNKVYKFLGKLSILHEDEEIGKKMLLDAKETGHYIEILVEFDVQAWRGLNS